MTTRTNTITYPDSDGMPLPDGETQAPQYINIVGTLRTFFRNVPDAHINGNTFIYFIEGNPRRSVSPDCYAALNLSEFALDSIRRNNTYLLWEVGKPPDFILEIGSPSTGREDLGRKRDLYAELGVSEYWRYDYTGGDFYGEPLAGEKLVNGEYHRFNLTRENDGALWGRSEILNLDLGWVDGELRFRDPASGEWLLNQAEEQAGRLAAETRIAELEAELRQLRQGP